MMNNKIDNTRKHHGMTLDDIRRRQLITRIKIDMTRRQIRSYIDASLNSGNSAQAIKLASNWTRLMQWAEYGVIGYRMYNRLRSMFRNGNRR